MCLRARDENALNAPLIILPPIVFLITSIVLAVSAHFYTNCSIILSNFALDIFMRALLCLM